MINSHTASQPAIILLSGGLDSATALGWAIANNYRIEHALSYSYGQQHVREIEAARAVAAYYGISHHVIELPVILGSSLTDQGSIPQNRDLGNLQEKIAPTYVPNRNMIFIAHAAAYAMQHNINILIGGWNGTDALNYPDCREDFLAITEQTLQIATLQPFTILRPLINADKHMIVSQAFALDVPINRTWTCYLGYAQACGLCDACQLRLSAFASYGATDPIDYAIVH